MTSDRSPSLAAYLVIVSIGATVDISNCINSTWRQKIISIQHSMQAELVIMKSTLGHLNHTWTSLSCYATNTKASMRETLQAQFVSLFDEATTVDLELAPLLIGYKRMPLEGPV